MLNRWCRCLARLIVVMRRIFMLLAKVRMLCKRLLILVTNRWLVAPLAKIIRKCLKFRLLNVAPLMCLPVRLVRFVVTLNRSKVMDVLLILMVLGYRLVLLCNRCRPTGLSRLCWVMTLRRPLVARCVGLSCSGRRGRLRVRKTLVRMRCRILVVRFRV